MSVSSVAPTPFYKDPERLDVGLPGDSTPKVEDSHLTFFANEEPSFWDVLDVINPLQHIPVISDIYQELTGDKIGVGARLAGGTLFGGVIGLVASAVDCMVEETTGKDTGGQMLALFRGDDGAKTPSGDPLGNSATQLADTAKSLPSAPSGSETAAVSSSPAPAEPGSAAMSLPLPETAGGTGLGGTLAFSIDGAGPANFAAQAQTSQASAQTQAAILTDTANPATAAATSAAAAPVAAGPAPAASAAHTAGAAAGKKGATPVAGGGRYMPTPSRSASPVEPKALPEITVPVSRGASRSTAPAAGTMAQHAATANTATTVQRLVGDQSTASVDGHPMLDGANAGNADWFTAAWSKALDKYEQSNRLNSQQAAQNTTQKTTE